MATIPEQIASDGVDSGTTRANTSLLTIVWQRKSLVILGIVIGLVLGALFYAQRTPVYQSQAQVLIVKRGAAPTPSTQSSASATSVFMEDYMSTQTVLLRSQIIAEKAANHETIKDRLQRDGFNSFPEAKKPEDLISGFMLALTVTRENKELTGGVTGNNVMTLTFRGTDQAECQLILNTLITVYQQFIDQTYQDISSSMLEQITKLRTEIENDILKADTAYSEFLQTVPIFIGKHGSGISVMHQKVDSLSRMVAKSEIDLKGKEYDLANLKKIKAESGNGAVIQYMITNGLAPRFFNDAELDKSLMAAKLDLNKLQSTYGEKHPLVVQKQKEIDLFKDIWKQQGKTNKKAETVTNGQDAEMDMADQYVAGLQMEVQMLQQKLALYTTDYEKASKELRANNRYDAEEDKLRTARERARLAFEQISRVEKDSSLRRDQGGMRVAVITKPGMGLKIAPNPYQVFTGFSLLGLLLGVGLAYLAEVSDKSFRNPTEIRKRLGLPVIGHIPYMAADEKAQQLVAAGSSTIDPYLITHYQSNSVAAEAYRGVRTALYFSTQGAGHQVIQVTSPNVSDGKSTLAANLAVSIAQSGKRTLLIDCDFRKPRVHKIFNVPAQLGMASAMAGQSDLGSAIQQTAVPNLSVLPCGPRPVNPAELLTSPKFSELIEQLRQMFDFVIVDTPPILVVTDPAVVAPRVDGVVLCIRVTKNGRPYAERAREVLTSLGANVLGVVVNGFGNQVGGGKYGYEHYNYGEGYSYTYGYTYGYADKEAASYYGNQSDEHAPAAKS